MAELSFSQKKAMQDALQEVLVERLRQHAKWGEQNHQDIEWFAVEGEEFGEVARAVVEGYFTAGRQQSEHGVRHELIQLAAVATAWVECLDRREREAKQDTRHLATSRSLCAPSFKSGSCGMYQCPGDGSCGCGPPWKDGWIQPGR